MTRVAVGFGDRGRNFLLRRQLALHVERGVKPRRIDSVKRIALTILSRFFQWRSALVVVRPETLLRASIGFQFLCERSCAQTTYQCIRQAPSASCLKPARKLTLCVIGVPSAAVESS